MKKNIRTLLRLKGGLRHATGEQEESMPTFEARMDERDARENRRREDAKKKIDVMPASEQVAARIEEDKKIADFDADKKLRLEARTQAK